MDDVLTRARPLQREQLMKFGTQITATGVRFRLWAPHSEAVSIDISGSDGPVPMQKLRRGWFEIEIEGAGEGTRYWYVMEDGTRAPDPASRYQPEDVHGPSEVVDPRRFEWTDAGWRGRPWEETILYEVHLGTFTAEGTFRAAIDKLDHLVSLGVTAIELMPLADFPGRWNWGYDGALLFAPDSSYGRPEDLKALVNAAHRRGLMVFLDVVYNHFGPEGNYLSVYAPVLTQKHSTPWGAAVNFDDEGSEMIRDFVISNARYWLNEFYFDGLRFDAVHEIQDTGPKHMLQDLAEQIRASTDGRHIHLVTEDSNNYAGWLKRREDGTPWLYTAQWSDDIHHGLHTAVTGESFWYYEDYVGRIDLLARGLAEGLAWQGEHMEKGGVDKGEPSAYLPATAFVNFIQNHDQAGNRPFGERLGHLIPQPASRALAAILLLCPEIPLLFMGEEWSAKQPFLYFADMGSELNDLIREGRRRELAGAPGMDDPSRAVPDPGDEATFAASKLVWEDRADAECREFLQHYKQLIALRQRELVPRLFGMEGFSGHYEVLGGKAFRVWWTLGDGSELSLAANLAPEPISGLALDLGDQLWLEGTASAGSLGAWSVMFRLSPKSKRI
jgi:maltooligosyltrehalose trehalohydrolase